MIVDRKRVIVDAVTNEERCGMCCPHLRQAGSMGMCVVFGRVQSVGECGSFERHANCCRFEA